LRATSNLIDEIRGLNVLPEPAALASGH
jgi:hypothetical protein